MNNQTQHTPGPWSFEVKEEGEYQYAPRIVLSPRLQWDGVAYKIDGQQDRRAEAIANARLIAAAPELLAALSAAYDALTDERADAAYKAEAAKALRAAIARAKGE